MLSSLSWKPLPASSVCPPFPGALGRADVFVLLVGRMTGFRYDDFPRKQVSHVPLHWLLWTLKPDPGLDHRSVGTNLVLTRKGMGRLMKWGYNPKSCLSRDSRREFVLKCKSDLKVVRRISPLQVWPWLYPWTGRQKGCRKRRCKSRCVFPFTKSM